MRRTRHDTNSLQAALVQFANTTEQPYAIMKADRRVYQTIKEALRVEDLPMIEARSFRSVMAIGRPQALAALDTKTAAHIQALKRSVVALQALATVVDTWNPYSGLAAVYGSPESFSRPCKMTEKPWRTEQPYETDLRVYGASLEAVAARYENRVCRYVPTAAEVDAMQIPGVDTFEHRVISRFGSDRMLAREFNEY